MLGFLPSWWIFFYKKTSILVFPVQTTVYRFLTGQEPETRMLNLESFAWTRIQLVWMGTGMSGPVRSSFPVRAWNWTPLLPNVQPWMKEKLDYNDIIVNETYNTNKYEQEGHWILDMSMIKGIQLLVYNEWIMTEDSAYTSGWSDLYPSEDTIELPHQDKLHHDKPEQWISLWLLLRPCGISLWLLLYPCGN